MTCPFDQAVLLLGEIRYGSLLGLKGIKQSALISGNVACQVFVSANITFYFSLRVYYNEKHLIKHLLAGIFDRSYNA